MEEIDGWDKVPSFDAGEAPRRSTSSLEPNVLACTCYRDGY
jgi:hypothetical protein